MALTWQGFDHQGVSRLFVVEAAGTSWDPISEQLAMIGSPSRLYQPSWLEAS